MKPSFVLHGSAGNSFGSVGKTLLGVLAGLIAGFLGTLAYSHLGESAWVAELQTQFNEINSRTVLAENSHNEIVQQSSTSAELSDRLSTENNGLRKQIDDLNRSISEARTRQISPRLLEQSMRDMNSRDSLYSWRGFLLEERLGLTADQETKLMGVLGADNSGGKQDQALKKVLTPDQQAEYQKIQTAERESRAESLATVKVSKMATLLQLSDEQKDQAMNAIYQAQTSRFAGEELDNVSRGSAIESAFAKVLTPDQRAIYQQAPK